MKHTILWRFALIGITLGNTSVLSAKEGWYAGFGGGSNKIDLDTPAIDLEDAALPSNVMYNGFDDDRFGFVFNGGYRMNANVALNFDFSATIADHRTSFFDSAASINYNYKNEIDSYYFTPGVHLIYPIDNKFEVYAKLGLSFILSDIKESSNSLSALAPFEEVSFNSTIKDWDIAPTIGFGGQWNFGKNWAATFEYTITQFELQPITSSDFVINAIDYETQNILVGMRYQFE